MSKKELKSQKNTKDKKSNTKKRKIQMKEIKVIDSPCGSGKTEWAIKYINSLPADSKVLFVTPYLDEISRIITSCRAKDIQQPKEKFGVKMIDFIDLVKEGKNIAMTHSLFSLVTKSAITKIKQQGYILILDEVMDVIRVYDSSDEDKYYGEDDFNTDYIAKTRKDIGYFKDLGVIEIDEEERVNWVRRDIKLSRYAKLKDLADTDSLYFINGTKLIYTLSPKLFSKNTFKDVYILTYMFDCQFQKYFCDFYEIPYKKYHIIGEYPDFELKATEDTDNPDKDFKEKIKSLVTIVDDENLNKIGTTLNASSGRRKNLLSASWYQRYYGENTRRNKYENITYVARKVVEGLRAEQYIWCTFKKYKTKVQDEYLAESSFLPLNMRAINTKSQATHCVYLVNRFACPEYKDFLKKKDIEINEKDWALSELIQWVWRSAIRNGKPITLFIPSVRMRTLFKKWLGNQNFPQTEGEK